MTASSQAVRPCAGSVRTTPRGFTLIEVLITLLVIAVGVLGLAALQGRSHLAAVESAQRAKAISVSNDMASRINLNRDNLAAYVTATPLGTGDALDQDDCAGMAYGPDRDRCEWSAMLKGAAERLDSANAGAMIGARGCVELIQAADPSPAVCKPAIVQVTATWQGLVETAAPSLQCGKDAFGDDRLRRAVATRIVIGLPRCL